MIYSHIAKYNIPKLLGIQVKPKLLSESTNVENYILFIQIDNADQTARLRIGY